MLNETNGYTYIFPAEHRFTALAVYVRDGVQPGQQHALLRRPAAHVYTGIR